MAGLIGIVTSALAVVGCRRRAQAWVMESSLSPYRYNRRSLTVLASLGYACLILFVALPAMGQTQGAGPDLDEKPAINEKEIEEIVIEEQKSKREVEPTELAKKLLNVPGAFGDPFAAVFSLPGIVEAIEGEGQPAVRGTGPEDNEFLIDFMPASYVFHALGISIFNEHLIRDFGIKAAGFGPAYDQAIGAIFDVDLREPRKEDLKTTLDLSFIKTGFLVEGSLGGDHAFYFSGRQSLIHLLIEQAEEELEDDEGIRFNRPPIWYDYQGKYSWDPDDKNRVTFLMIGADDGIAISLDADSDAALVDPGLEGRSSFDSKFNSHALRWDRLSDTTELRAGIGRLDEEFVGRFGGIGDRITVSRIVNTTKVEQKFLFHGLHALTLGTQLQYIDFAYDINLRYESCTAFDPNCDSALGDTLEVQGSQAVRLNAIYADYEWEIGNWTFKPGVRHTENDYLQETLTEPRFKVSYRVNDQLLVSSSYGEYNQLPMPEEMLPRVGNPNLKSPNATHFVLGVSWALSDLWDLDIELYQKNLKDLVLNVDHDPNYINAVTGHARGIDMKLERKESEHWYGWLTASLTESERFNQITGNSFKSANDTPVVLNLLASYKTAKWTYSARWNLRSGAPYTPIIGNRENPQYPGFYIPVYGEINSARADAYHRLDLRAERQYKTINATLYFELINAYGSNNTGSAFYEPIAGSDEFRVQNEEGIPTLPSIGFAIKF